MCWVLWNSFCCRQGKLSCINFFFDNFFSSFFFPYFLELLLFGYWTPWINVLIFLTFFLFYITFNFLFQEIVSILIFQYFCWIVISDLIIIILFPWSVFFLWQLCYLFLEVKDVVSYFMSPRKVIFSILPILSSFPMTSVYFSFFPFNFHFNDCWYQC